MSAQTNLNLVRIADQINVILTQIFRKYVAQGSPTKLGGLRFLDVESSKTFAFENTGVSDDQTGNILLFSAPYANIDQEVDPQDITDKKVVETDPIERVKSEVRAILKNGPYGDALVEDHLKVRPSKDAGKGSRYFIEVGYYIPTCEWLSDEAICSYAETHKVNNSREAIVRILEEKVIDMADEIMQFLIHHLRGVKATV